MAEATQSYATHRRYFPLFHFFAVPLLVANLIVRIIYAWMHRGARLVWWEIVVAVALLAVAFASRVMALTVQDRLIRLEETTRLQRCLPDDLRGRIGELSGGQLVALRFCSDDEVAGLTRSVLDGKLKTATRSSSRSRRGGRTTSGRSVGERRQRSVGVRACIRRGVSPGGGFLSHCTSGD